MRILTAALFLLVLAGCGGEASNGGGSTSTSKTPVMPTCSKVWVNGATLPKGYDGCVRSDGDIEAAVTHKCDSGIGTFTTFQDHYFALLGGKITKAKSDSQAYSKAYNDCFAG